MYQKNFKYPDTKAHEFVIARLAKRGVSLDELAKLVYETQKDFELGLTLEECNITKQTNNAMVMLELDRLTEEGKVASPLAEIIENDSGVFGVDETLALQIANIYGTIGATNFGYFDRVKSGIIKKFDTSPEHVNTFIDDLLAAIVAATCGKIAHKYA